MKRPIQTINPRLGDESFVAVFGRVPTMHDDARTRVATHVGYVACRLRERDASHDHTAYDVTAKLGSEVRFEPHMWLLEGGVELDAYGPSIPRAWSLPVQFAYRHTGEHQVAGIHGGPRFALGNTRDTGWNVGLDYRRKGTFFEEGRWAPSDLVISFDATHVAGALFLGVTVGVGNARTRSQWNED